MIRPESDNQDLSGPRSGFAAAYLATTRATERTRDENGNLEPVRAH
jgi:hypothetical protein